MEVDNYLEKRWFVKIEKFKSGVIFLLQIHEIKITRKLINNNMVSTREKNLIYFKLDLRYNKSRKLTPPQPLATIIFMQDSCLQTLRKFS